MKNQKTYYTVVSLIILLLTIAQVTPAQSIQSIKNVQDIEDAMFIRLNDETELVIPSVTAEEMIAIKDAEQYMLVYKENEDRGYYSYINQEWVGLTIRELFVNTHNNLQMAIPAKNTMIVVTEDGSNKELIDYNQHVANINSILYNKKRSYAINESKQKHGNE